MTASILDSWWLYTLQLYIAEKSLVGKKFLFIFQGFYRFRFLLHRYFFFSLFSLTNVCLPYRLSRAYSVPCAPNRCVGSETPKHKTFDQFWNLNSILNIFQKTCAIWYHLYNIKNVKNTHGGVLLYVKLKAEACIFTKINTSPWVFFTYFKLYKWYQIAQSIT